MSDNPGVIIPPPLMFATAGAAGALLDGNVPDWGQLAEPLRVAGALLILSGLALIGAALGLFRRAGTRPEPWQPSSALVEAGPYRFTRNPMYLGMALISAGLAACFESLGAAGLSALTVLIVDRFVISREEAYLIQRFGEAYADYRRRVRRWL